MPSRFFRISDGPSAGRGRVITSSGASNEIREEKEGGRRRRGEGGSKKGMYIQCAVLTRMLIALYEETMGEGSGRHPAFALRVTTSRRRKEEH